MRTKSNKRKGFTLAEVLITLGIVGIVAAMTMPALITKHREKATVAKLKKSYSILNQAYLRAVSEHGEVWDWEFPADSSYSRDPETGETIFNEDTLTNSKLFFDIMTEHMSGVKKCYQPTCDISNFHLKSLTGQEKSIRGYLSIIDLPDGISFIGAWISKSTKHGDFGVDINGTNNPPNVVGEDIFYFKITSKGIEPYGSSNEILGQKFPLYCNKLVAPLAAPTNNGYACTAWVIQNENMDYLHCDDLSWGGKHKCK